MIGIDDRTSVHIDGVWIADEGLWLTALDWHGPLQRLKKLLFAWHVGSWYGAEVTEKLFNGQSGLLVPALLAADYLTQSAHVQLMKLQWSERLQRLIEGAGIVRNSLLSGWYQPVQRTLEDNRQKWRLHLPEQEAQQYELWQVSAQRLGLTGESLQQWLSLAVEAAISSDPAANSAMRQLEPRLRRGAVSISAMDEEDWLVSIGWKSDTTPYRVLLQLLEPAESSGWRLAVLLQDRERSEQRVEVRPDGEGQWQQLLPPSDWPSDWAAGLPERLAKEQRKWLAACPQWQLDNGGMRFQLSDEEAWTLLETDSLKLLEAGCSLLLPAWWEAVRSRKLRLKAKVKSSVGSVAQPMFGLDTIVQFDWKLAVGNMDLSENEFMQLVNENKRLFQVNNEWVHLDPKDLEQLRKWMGSKGKKKGLSFRDVLEMHLRGANIDDHEDEDQLLEAEVVLNEHLSQWLEQLQTLSDMPMLEKPSSFLGELRPYQLQGVSWLAFLRRFGLGGCLADDMGLGKTIQFTAYLLNVKETGVQLGEQVQTSPSLLICPTSVIGNWEKELARFAPTLRTVVHYGPRRPKGIAFEEAVRDADLVITSYSLGQLDEEELMRIHWDALCLDEAQNIKNVYTKQAIAIRQLSANHRIAMTGTPMENRLTELWSIHDFINPGYLGSLGEFRREVVQPIERSQDAELIAKLQRWVKPFMLRRVKKDPAIQLALPDKNEAKTYISLTVEQGTLYENLVSSLLDKLNTLTPMQRRGLILATLTKLKQVCNHPSLLLKEAAALAGAADPARSNKLIRLSEMIEEIAAEGERCLIFTQFVGMGRMLQAHLSKQTGVPVPYLHGGVPRAERDAMISAFQDSAVPHCAFVLSLKAGGTGLNLTAANHVVHFDRWWNPAVENQATDRAFRIGQTKEVQVHKFVTLGTLEEKIDDMIDRKQTLNEQVVGVSENWITELSKDELTDLFTLRKTWLNKA